jgi:hypothetical protein
MNDEKLYPPRCCVVLPWEEVKALLPHDLATSFEQRKAELDTPAGERLYCAEPACSHVLGTRTIRARSVVCSLCNSATCTKCRAVSHAGACPDKTDEAVQQTLRQANEQGWQTCQRCKQVVDQIPGGCNHMTCRCGHQFCYAYGERWGTCDCQVYGALDDDFLDHDVLYPVVLNPGVNVLQDMRDNVHPGLLAAQARYREARRDVEMRWEQLDEAEEVLEQAGEDLLQIIQDRQAQ